MHDNEICHGVRDTIPFDRLRDLARTSRACFAGDTEATYVIGWVEIPYDLGMERLCSHGLLRLGKERLHGSSLEMERTGNLGRHR